jgi:phosphopantetheinyl transferase (holo-ACP synthase)
VEVVVDPSEEPSGPPRLVLRGSAAELAKQRGVTEFFVSLTHTATIAQAMVLAQAT